MSLTLPFDRIVRDAEESVLAELLRTRLLVRVAEDVPEMDLCMVSSIHLDVQRGALVSFEGTRGRQQVYLGDLNKYTHGLNTLSSAVATFSPTVLKVLKRLLPDLDVEPEIEAPPDLPKPEPEAPAPPPPPPPPPTPPTPPRPKPPTPPEG